MQFDGYEFKNFLVKAIEDLGFKEFTPIQKMVFDNMKLNNNVIAKSKTGSGKTHAYLLPIFEDLDPTNPKTQAVIITPTIELARQVYKVAQHLASFSGDEIVIKAYYGGSDLQKDIAKIKSTNPQIVIATPGRLEDLVIKQNVLKIHEANYLIIDEADMVVDSFLDNLFTLNSSLESARKMVFSATFRQSLLVLLKKYLTNTVMLEPKEETVESLAISHYLIPLKYQEKDIVLAKLVSIINPYLCIIFVNKKEDTFPIYQMLKEKGFSVCEFNGDLDLRQRKRIANEINALRYQFVVATDILARGIDIIGVSHIINYDLPNDFEFYIHRSGRAGRAQFSGICYTLYSHEDLEYLDSLKQRGINFSYLKIKDDSLVEAADRTRGPRPLTEEEKKALRSVKGGTKVKPGYKKKFQKESEKALKKVRKFHYYH